MLREIIVNFAKTYIGKKEIKNNMGFFDSKFNRDMESVGFEKGHAWCAYFAELVWTKGFQKYYQGKLNGLPELITKLFSANANQTFNRLANAGFISSKDPFPGDLAVWMSYKKGEPRRLSPKLFAGHIGIISEVTNNGFKCIEGNTNSKGGREGIEVAEKNRSYNWTSSNGLRLIGFIKPYTTKLP